MIKELDTVVLTEDLPEAGRPGDRRSNPCSRGLRDRVYDALPVAQGAEARHQ